ncbi:MAG TPA: hypothetical protein VMF58_10155 [Rhizomicrobium sp.]|nr:hypothetical protein [Rhizomicrobium sp.]
MTVVRFGLAFALALSCSASKAADFAKTGPGASAASLIAARGNVNEPAVEFIYKIEGSDPGTITVDLAQDFVSLSKDRTLLIYDFALRRLITIDDASHSFLNASLYGAVDFFVSETFNRRFQRGALSSIKVSDQVRMLDPFWVQSQLHVMSPEDGTPKIERRAAATGTVHFLYGGAEIASYTPSTQALTKENGALLAKFLRYYGSLHPVVVDDIVASGRLPQRLSFESVGPEKTSDNVWTLQSAQPVHAVYPLLTTSKLTFPSFTGAASSVASLVPTMQAAIAGKAPGRRTAEESRAATEAALKAQKPFQALLLALELNEQFGKQAAGCVNPQGCHTLKEIVAAAGSDPRTPVLLKALEDNSSDKNVAIPSLQSMKRDDLSNAYVLDEFLANDLMMAGRPDEALPPFVSAIKGNPYLAGYYKDLGSLFRARFQPDLAWFCFDMGRALPGGADAPILSDINGYEADLAKKYPEFF